MTEVLTVRIKEIQRRFPTWSPDQCLRGRGDPGSALSWQGTVGTNVIHVPDPLRPHRFLVSVRKGNLSEALRAVGSALTCLALAGGLCAYVGGPSYVRSSQDLGCDFCNDVLARAKYFKRHGF